MVKWTTELGEYDIQYEPRVAILAQALSDFFAETLHAEIEEPWKLYVSSYSEGSGVGVVLISPKGDEVKLAVRLDFWASNNEAEYEAVLAGLQTALNAGARRVHISSDSQLVAQQVNGAYEVRNDKIREYIKTIEKLKEQFEEIVSEQIPRESNEQADLLAKMASSSGSWRNRDILMQIKLVPCGSSEVSEME